jgi:hypothetical protein
MSSVTIFCPYNSYSRVFSDRGSFSDDDDFLTNSEQFFHTTILHQIALYLDLYNHEKESLLLHHSGIVDN